MRVSLKSMLCVAGVALLTGCGGGDAPTDPTGSNAQIESRQSDAAIRLEDPPLGQLPEGVTPTAYTLDLVLDPEQDTFSGVVEIDVTLDAPHSRIWLHALGPVVESVTATLVDGEQHSGTFTGDQGEGGVSRIDFDQPLPAGPATLTLKYTAPYDRTLAGLYRADQSGKAYLASQMGAIDARRMVPSFDEPRFKTPFTVSIASPHNIKVVTNGALKAINNDNPNLNVLRLFETTRPLPTYLLGLIVGPYDEVVGDDIPPNDLRAEAIPFRGFAPAGKGEKLQEAMDITARMLTYQENYFGVPYPYGKLDIAAVPDFAFGAMENAGIIIYREAALLIDERTSLSRKRGVFTIHAHELAHQWFGNLVTPKWWDDIWLNESFATWFAYKTMHAMDPEGGFDRTVIRRSLGAMGSDSLKNARQIRNPVDRNSAIMDAFDGITYSKGGGVLTMFENYLGAEHFREGVRLYMKRFPDGVADVNDFMQSLADGSGDAAIVDSFKSFIFQPGIPYLDVQVVCNDPNNKHLNITQKRYAPLGSDIDPGQLWQVPFSVIWGSEDGRGGARTVLTNKETIIALEESACPDWVMPNADGKGYWRFTTNEENWTGLTEVFAELSPGEQLVMADSLTAAFNAGDVTAETMLAGLKATASGRWDAASQGMNEIGAYMSLLSEEDRPALRKFMDQTYRPAWEFYGDRTAAQLSQGERLLQEQLYSTMVNYVQDPGMRASLLERAYDFVGVNGTPNPSAISPAELSSAMTVAAQTGGRDFLDAALRVAYASNNQNERSTIFGTLAQNLPAEDVAILLKEANGGEFTGREMYATFMNAMDNERARDQNWTLFKQSWENLSARAPEVRKANLARAAGSFCDVQKSKAAAEFFRSESDKIAGYERSLAQALESSALCAALKDTKSEELAAALTD